MQAKRITLQLTKGNRKRKQRFKAKRELKVQKENKNCSKRMIVDFKCEYEGKKIVRKSASVI